jgi:hypothetical protein
MRLFNFKSAQPGNPSNPMDGGIGQHLKHNLLLGLRACVFLPLPVRGPHVTWNQLVILLALNLLLQLGWDLIQTGRAGELALNAAPGAFFILPVLFICAWALAALLERTDQTLLLLITFFAIALPIDLSTLLLTRLLDRPLINRIIPNWGALSAYFLLFWFALAAGVACIRLLQAKTRRLVVLLLAIFCIVGPLSQVVSDRSFWIRPFEETATSQPSIGALDTEDIFYLQAKLLDQALASIKPSDPSKTNLYYIGLAGFAGQDVFMKEVEYVQKLFRQRFNTAERSLVLINNAQTANRIPIASSTSLRAALQHISGIMNRKKDILFLYLSSHGSKDFKFILEFGNMRFNDLDPQVLRQMLDEAGIQRRVIVISACYSGGFINALKNENTLIISAAAPEKTSFGCSNDADFTYFGRAYFQEALQQTDSFIDAFALAKRAIAIREKKDGFESSEPGMFVGAKIAKALEEVAEVPMRGRHSK